MYTKLPNLIIGFHGCDLSVAETIISGKDTLQASENDYDWLGHGIYFWEQSLDRAKKWAEESSNIKSPAVVGAIIDLGYCLNLTDTGNTELLKSQYAILKREALLAGTSLPTNSVSPKLKAPLRKLDCAVIESLHKMRSKLNFQPFDSVRGIFYEGNPLYESSGFMERTHVQICIRNPNCIKGYFMPQKANDGFILP